MCNNAKRKYQMPEKESQQATFTPPPSPFPPLQEDVAKQVEYLSANERCEAILKMKGNEELKLLSVWPRRIIDPQIFERMQM